MQDNVPSPVSGGRTRVAALFDTAPIIRRYADVGADVSAYYAGFDQVELRQCLDTGYRFFHPASLEGGSDFYDQWLTDGLDYREWGDDYQFAADRIEDGISVLDVGCGYGKFLSRIADRTRAVGLDGNAKVQAKCVEMGLDVRLGYFSDNPDLVGQFDVVTAFQVLEHVYDVRAFMAGAIAALKPGGRLIVAVPNNDPYFNRFDKYDTLNTPPHHVGLWNIRSLKAAAPYFGLEATDCGVVDPSNRAVVLAYIRAKYWAGVKSELHKHSRAELARILAFAPPALVASFASSLMNRGVVARNIAAIVYRKAH